MNRRSTICLAAILLALLAPAILRAQTLARLAHDTAPDLPHTRPVKEVPPPASSQHHPPLRESALARLAARAFFVDSNLERARVLSARAIAHDPQDAAALFVRMEVAGLQADEAEVVRAATALCEVGTGAPHDLRVRLAALRLRESAANTAAFREVIPRLQTLLANSSESSPDLREALLSAAMDGVSGLDPYALSRAAGVLTDWRIVGPLGLHPLLDQQPISPSDDLSDISYQNHRVENFAFPDGRIVLPQYFSRRGVFYAATNFSSLTAGTWTVGVQSAGPVEVYADGQRILRADGQSSASAEFAVIPGPHHILLKFVASATPLRVAVNKTTEAAPVVLPRKISPQELTYLLAAGHYAAGEVALAAAQLENLPGGSNSAALQFLLAQSQTKLYPTTSDTVTMWDKLVSLAPTAWGADLALSRIALQNGDPSGAFRLASQVLAAWPASAAALDTLTAALSGSQPLADVNAASLWPQSIAVHPSCSNLHGAIRFDREHGQVAAARAAQQKLDGCAPESLDYAQSLSKDGDHTAAARSLERLLAAAPLNRAARQMLVRELQLSGDDEAAQRAAAEWLHIAPNAENYHRLAALVPAEADDDVSPRTFSAGKDFYLPYRRDAATIARQTANTPAAADIQVLLDDHVAILRPDGSVSLYVHRAQRALTQQATAQLSETNLPRDAQVLALRIVHADGSTAALNNSTAALSPGDAIDEEYILHYAGDGGIPEHAEAFQFVFGSFGRQVLYSRFAVLVPADRADRGVVIATGDAPAMTSTLRDGMLERMWDQRPLPEKDDPSAARTDSGLAIIRVVEQENGWVEPSSAEHRHRIETIHPGPRPEDS